MEFFGTNRADGVLERPFRLGAVPGVMWTRDQPGQRSGLVLLAHGGGQHKSAPAVAARAQRYLKELDAAVVAIDAPGHGDRDRGGRDELFIERLTQARRDGAPVGALIEEYNADVATRALPEFSEVLTAVQLQWDDEFVDRAVGLGMYDAIASAEKTLHANAGGHAAVPRFELGAEARFFARHLPLRPSAVCQRPRRRAGAGPVHHARKRIDGGPGEPVGLYSLLPGSGAPKMGHNGERPSPNLAPFEGQEGVL